MERNVVFPPAQDTGSTQNETGRLQNGTAAEDKHEGSVQSGIKRTLETRLYPLQASGLGVGMLKLFSRLQETFKGREWGTGYLVTAS